MMRRYLYINGNHNDKSSLQQEIAEITLVSIEQALQQMNYLHLLAKFMYSEFQKRTRS
jgi:hypothetical protein